jgi:hypothetical protein
MRELILSVCQKSKDSFREKKPVLRPTGGCWALGTNGQTQKRGAQWAPMGEVFFFAVQLNGRNRKKKKAHMVGAAGQEKLSDNLAS